MASSRRSLVMGVAAGYTAEQVLPFLRSLRSTGYAGRVILFVSRMNEQVLRPIRELADEVIGLDEYYGSQVIRARIKPLAHTLRFARATRRVRRIYPALFRMTVALASREEGRRPIWRDLEQYLEGFQSLRYLHYLTYLSDEAPEADLVMLSDVRDVLFQQDPFFEPLKAELEVYLESDHVKLGINPFNSRWIRNLYGADTAVELGEKIVSCSGTTLGSRTGIIRYLERVCGEIAKQLRPLGSHDQGIHNYLVHTNRLEPLAICPNGEGRVLTVGEQVEIKLNDSGEVLNTDGKVVSVVHQYDRHPVLANQLWKRHGL